MLPFFPNSKTADFSRILGPSCSKISLITVMHATLSSIDLASITNHTRPWYSLILTSYENFRSVFLLASMRFSIDSFSLLKLTSVSVFLIHMPHLPVYITLSLVSRLMYAEDNVNIASESELVLLLLPILSTNLLKNVISTLQY